MLLVKLYFIRRLYRSVIEPLGQTAVFVISEWGIGWVILHLPASFGTICLFRVPYGHLASDRLHIPFMSNQVSCNVFEQPSSFFSPTRVLSQLPNTCLSAQSLADFPSASYTLLAVYISRLSCIVAFNPP